MPQACNKLAEYWKERDGRETIETDKGFISYWIDGDRLHIIDIFVYPEFRSQGEALMLLNEAVQIGIKAGCNCGIAQADSRSLNATESIKFILSVGMKLLSVEGPILYFIMEREKWAIR